jgi:acyl carrier protein
MRDKIIEILNDTRPEFDFEKESEGFLEKGFLDSFDIISLVTDFEEVFGLSIPGDQIIPENFNSISAIINVLNKINK